MQAPSATLERVSSTSSAPLQDSNTPVDPQPQPQSSKNEPLKRTTRRKLRRESRPDQVDPRPLQSLKQWRKVRAARSTMYYGFYADDYTLQKMLIRRFPALRNRDPTNDALLYPAILYLRQHFNRDDISVHTAYLPQRARDLNPEIQDEIGDEILIIGLFELEEEAFLDRMTQKEVDELAELLGKKPTWWHIAQSSPGT